MKKILKISALLLSVLMLSALVSLAVGAEGDGWHSDAKGWYYVKGGSVLCSSLVNDSKGTCYCGADGYLVYNRWIWGPKGWFHLNAEGYLETDTTVADNTGLCLVDSNGIWVSSTGWHLYNGKWVYVGANKHLTKNAWVQDTKGWCHINSEGFLDTDTAVADSSGMCLVDSNGHWVTAVGWHKLNGKWVYVNADKRLAQSEWIYDGKGWCHLNSSCTLDTNTKNSDSVGVCLINTSGYWVKTAGWYSYGGAWYYIGTNSRLVLNDWVSDSKGSYHLSYDGTLDTDTVIMDSTGLCLVDKEGLWVKTAGWHKLGDGSFVYVGSNSRLVTSSWVQYNGSWCHLGLVGILDTDTLVADADGYCYVNSDGYWIKTAGWRETSDGRWVYIGTGHRAMTNYWVYYKSNWYHLDAYGYMETDTLVEDSVGLCYMNAKGCWASDKGWYTVRGDRKVFVGDNKRAFSDVWLCDSCGWFHMNESGYLDTSTIVSDTKGYCYVNAKGYWVTAEGSVSVALWDTSTHQTRNYTVYIEKGGYLKKSGSSYYKQ